MSFMHIHSFTNHQHQINNTLKITLNNFILNEKLYTSNKIIDDSIDNCNISDIIKLKRKEKGLMVKELAKITKIQKQTIIKIEKGKSNPTPHTLKKIADALDIDLRKIIKPKNDSIAEKIKTLRLQMGLSQREFAKKIGADQSSVIEWENDRRKPSKYYIERINEFLHLKIDNNIE